MTNMNMNQPKTTENKTLPDQTPTLPDHKTNFKQFCLLISERDYCFSLIFALGRADVAGDRQDGRD